MTFDGQAHPDGSCATQRKYRELIRAGPSLTRRVVSLLATCGADDPGGLNAVVTIGPEALLFLRRGYAARRRRSRPGSCFDSARGLRAANGCALLLAKPAHSVLAGFV